MTAAPANRKLTASSSIEQFSKSNLRHKKAPKIDKRASSIGILHAANLGYGYCRAVRPTATVGGRMLTSCRDFRAAFDAAGRVFPGREPDVRLSSRGHSSDEATQLFLYDGSLTEGDCRPSPQCLMHQTYTTTGAFLGLDNVPIEI